MATSQTAVTGGPAARTGYPRRWLAAVAGVAALVLLEAKKSGHTVAPLLRAGLFRVPAFAAGLGVQLVFFGGMQGFFLTFALWLQAGQHFSPLKAGLTAVAFSVGSFVLAPMAVPLAKRHGRLLLPRTAVSEEALTE